MSDNERPDLQALEELEQLVRALGEEVAVWRRRGQMAEGRLRETEHRLRDVEAALASGTPPQNERVTELEREAAELRDRLDAAAERTRILLGRTQFLRQQHEQEPGR